MYIKSLRATNYRGLASFEASDFRLINMIGGLNGAGKSTFLEALFTIADSGNPSVFLRPFNWRKMQVTVKTASSFLFSNADSSKPAILDTVVHDGHLKIKFTDEVQTPPTAAQIPVNKQRPSQEPTAQSGITVQIFLNNKLIDSSHALDLGPDTIQVWKGLQSNRTVKKCVFLSSRTVDSPAETAQRFTDAIQRREKSTILELARLVVPQIQDIILLQIGGNPTLCGSIEPDVYVPIQFLGDGAYVLINVGLAIMDCPGGMILLDEFDASIHYSKLNAVWQGLAKVAKARNCQIFAATHSSESIEAAMEGMETAKLTSDLSYMRLDRIDGKVRCTTYSHAEIKDSLAEDWEIR